LVWRGLRFSHVPFDVEDGLIELPGAPLLWIWAFTRPTPKCGCRTAIVLSAPGDREMLRECGRQVAEAWLVGNIERSAEHHDAAVIADKEKGEVLGGNTREEGAAACRAGIVKAKK